MYHLFLRETYQNIFLEVTEKPWCMISVDVKGKYSVRVVREDDQNMFMGIVISESV